MPPKKTTSQQFTSQQSSESERLLLAKAIASLTQTQASFIESVEHYKSITEESLRQVDLEMDIKKKEFAEQSKQLDKEFSEKNEELDSDYKKKKLEYDQELKNKKIDVEQELREHKYDAITQMLENDFNEIAVDKDEYDALQGELMQLRDSYEKDLEKAKVELRNAHAKELNASIGSNNLKHTAETAELTASVKQQEREISILNSTIENLKKELAAQRELTREVAVAGKQGSINQTFGK